MNLLGVSRDGWVPTPLKVQDEEDSELLRTAQNLSLLSPLTWRRTTLELAGQSKNIEKIVRPSSLAMFSTVLDTDTDGFNQCFESDPLLRQKCDMYIGKDESPPHSFLLLLILFSVSADTVFSLIDSFFCRVGQTLLSTLNNFLLFLRNSLFFVCNLGGYIFFRTSPSPGMGTDLPLIGGGCELKLATDQFFRPIFQIYPKILLVSSMQR